MEITLERKSEVARENSSSQRIDDIGRTLSEMSVIRSFLGHKGRRRRVIRKVKVIFESRCPKTIENIGITNRQ